MILMAHQVFESFKFSRTTWTELEILPIKDTVPVNPDTIDQWTYPPWSGYYDGTWIWGRGSSDCKNQLIAVLEGRVFLSFTLF
jgi:Gly-Xaa carboxypeptidase